MLTFLPSRTIAEPFSPSRVRCAAPNTRRALDRSGRLCKISPLGRKVGLRKAKSRQNQNVLDIHRHSHGRRSSNFALFVRQNQGSVSVTAMFHQPSVTPADMV